MLHFPSPAYCSIIDQCSIITLLVAVMSISRDPRKSVETYEMDVKQVIFGGTVVPNILDRSWSVRGYFDPTKNQMQVF